MQEEQLTKKEIGFPWLSLTVYVVVAIAAIAFDVFTTDLTELSELGPEISANPEAVMVGALIGGLVGVIGGFIGIATQYAFIKFPTQWISKEQNVYKNEIWEALFYSSAISIVLSTLMTYFNFQGNILVTLITSLITVAAFLLIYFSGSEKEPQIKKAIIIVQVIWAVVGFIFGLFSIGLMNNLPV